MNLMDLTSNNNDNNISVYWINMEKSEKRRIRMENNTLSHSFFKKCNHIERIIGVDGEQCEEGKIMACTRSHIKAIETLSKSTNTFGFGLILEDDMTMDYFQYWESLTSNGHDYLSSIIDNAPDDWEILQLCYISQSIPTILYENKKTNMEGVAGPGSSGGGHERYSTGAYLLRQSTANILMNRMKTLELTLQKYPEADHYIYSLGNTYCYRFPIFTYKFWQMSTLHENHEVFHNTSRQRIEQMYTLKRRMDEMIYFKMFFGSLAACGLLAMYNVVVQINK